MTLSGKRPVIVHCSLLVIALSIAVSGSIIWRGDAIRAQSLTAQLLDDLDKGNQDIRCFCKIWICQLRPSEKASS